MSKELESRIKDILITLPSTKIDGLKKLFWEELNYNSDNVPVSKANWTDEFSDLFVETPVSFATCATNDAFHILFFHLYSDKLQISTERQVVNKLIVDYPYSLFVFSNRNQDRWHFVNAIQNKDKKRSKQFILRRISVSKEDRLRTASERITKLDVSLVEAPLFGVSPIQIQKLHEAAFDVEAVTEEFFNEYKTVFSSLMSELKRQTSDKTWAHDFALQFMNRLMFIYYIERKEWLGNDPDFLHHFWREYLKLYKGSDRFVDEWLDVLFFEAFNKKFSAGRSDYQYIPEEFRTALQLAPYLNGGLFSKNELDEKYDFHIDDYQIERIMAFLDKYNFTISEDTPLDQEVAVDPEMIGKVYESLVNVSEEVDEQSDAGIFYTPRIEIDLMCRLSLVDWLSNHLTEISKNVIYEFVFAFNPEDKQEADKTITDLGLWQQLEELLSGVTVLDPACGSGSFLVGMLGVLDDLLIRSNKHLNKEETPYERRKRIIGSSLYGVDIMDWAVHVAELRLWLQLVIETDLDIGVRISQALLPSLSFKLRQGDSLVQEVGGINLSLHRKAGQLNSTTLNQLKSLKNEKLKFFQNDPGRKYRTKSELTQAEFLLFEQVIADQIRTLEARKLELQTLLNPGKNLFGEAQPSQMDDSLKRNQELEIVSQNLESLRSARNVLQTQKTIPFIWDIAFVEIFEGEKQGFDIVIGNPPYTRQEAIRDLKLPEELSNLRENKRAYKAKVATAIHNAWPKTFGFNPAKGNASWKLDKKSDLYIYFYFIGLSLLNPQGSLCFITSNAWVDVEYGIDLQKFILLNGQLLLLLDNRSKRSFKNASVNTIVALMKKPKDRKSQVLLYPQGVVKFVMFKVPFEEGLNPIIWEEIFESSSDNSTEEYKLRSISQEALFQVGYDYLSEDFAGGKWGAFYLRAPDILHLILEKNINRLSNFSSFVAMKRGLTPGSVGYFFITEEIRKQFCIEEKYLRPIITSSQTLSSYVVDKNCNILYCHESKEDLRSTSVYDYILFGEREGIDKIQTVSNHRPYWYSLHGEPFDVLLLRFWDVRFWTPFSNTDILCSDTFFYGKVEKNCRSQTISMLNSSFYYMQINTLGRTNQGEGVLATYGYEYKSIKIPSPSIIDYSLSSKFYNELTTKEVPTIYELAQSHSQRELDSIVFEYLNMTRMQIDDFYERLIELVNLRKNRAKSLR